MEDRTQELEEEFILDHIKQVDPDRYEKIRQEFFNHQKTQPPIYKSPIKLEGLPPSINDRLLFMDNVMADYDQSIHWAQGLIKSKAIPDYFHSPEQVLFVLMYGHNIGMKPALSLTQLIPRDGIVLIKGDGAKSLIFTSPQFGAWNEKESGSVEEENYQVEVHCSRKDGPENTILFNVDLAKRAGLWVSDEQAKKLSYKFTDKKQEIRFKYPERMIRYIAISWAARAMFPDVMHGLVTVEEADNYVAQLHTITASGQTIGVPDQVKENERSESKAEKVNSRLQKSSFLKSTKTEELPEGKGKPEMTKYTEDELIELKGDDGMKEIRNICKDMGILFITLPGRNTNAKLRKLILAKQANKLADYITKTYGEKEAQEYFDSIDRLKETPPTEKVEDEPVDDKTEAVGSEPKSDNILGIEIDQAVSRVDGEEPARPLANLVGIYQAVVDNYYDKSDPELMNKKFTERLKVLGFKEKYGEVQNFLRKAPVDEVIIFINSHGEDKK